MMFILILLTGLSQAQIGPKSKDVCLQNLASLQDVLNRSTDCKWNPYPESKYDTTTRRCSGTFVCKTPYPEQTPTYLVPKAACVMPNPPPGGLCGNMDAACKKSFIDLERVECNRL